MVPPAEQMPSITAGEEGFVAQASPSALLPKDGQVSLVPAVGKRVK